MSFYIKPYKRNEGEELKNNGANTLIITIRGRSLIFADEVKPEDGSSLYICAASFFFCGREITV